MAAILPFLRIVYFVTQKRAALSAPATPLVGRSLSLLPPLLPMWATGSLPSVHGAECSELRPYRGLPRCLVEQCGGGVHSPCESDRSDRTGDLLALMWSSQAILTLVKNELEQVDEVYGGIDQWKLLSAGSLVLSHNDLQENNLMLVGSPSVSEDCPLPSRAASDVGKNEHVAMRAFYLTTSGVPCSLPSSARDSPGCAVVKESAVAFFGSCSRLCLGSGA